MTLSTNTISPIELQQEAKTILVSGSGTASDRADEATVILGVQTEGKTASEASRENAELMASVIDAIKDLGLTEEDMRDILEALSEREKGSYYKMEEVFDV